MREAYRGYYPPSRDELDELWTVGLVVLDTNTLLNFYRYTTSTVEDFWRILQRLAERLWIPHQVGLEFQRGRIGVMEQQTAAFDTALEAIRNGPSALESALKRFRNHPALNGASLVERYRHAVEPLVAEVTRQAAAHGQQGPPNYLEDPTWDRLTTLLAGKVGPPFSSEELECLYTEGRTRYEQKIPPGFRDAAKPEPTRFGDFILWKQILKHASHEGRPVVFVTDDEKEDWWRVEHGRTLGPRVELVEEFWGACGKRVHFYTPDRFLKYAGERTTTTVSAATLGEARTVSDTARNQEFLEHLMRAREATMAERNSMVASLRGFSSVDEAVEEATNAATLREFRDEREMLRREEILLAKLADSVESEEERERYASAARSARASRHNLDRRIAEHGHARGEWRAPPDELERLRRGIAGLDDRLARIDAEMGSLGSAAEGGA